MTTRWTPVLALLFSIVACNTTTDEPERSTAAPDEPIVAEGSAIAPIQDGAHHQVVSEEADVQDRIENALLSGLEALVEASMSTVPVPEGSENAASPTPGARHLRIVFASNVHGELEDCGCRRNPLGGLARRATMLAEPPDGLTPDQVLHVDSGDLLARRVGTGTNGVALDGSEGAVKAMALLRGLTTMGIDAINLGHHDLGLGADFLRDAAEATEAPLVSANLFVGDELVGESRRIVAAGDVRVGFTGVIGGEVVAPDFWDNTGFRRTAPLEPAVAEIEALRGAGVDLVVLMVSSGLNAAEALVTDLEGQDALPDLVLVSGTRRSLREPHFVSGVPLLEAGDRGKQLMFLDLTLRGDAIAFEPVDAGRSRLDSSVSTTIRMIQVARGNLRQVLDDPDRIEQADQYRDHLTRYHERLRNLVGQVADLTPLAPEAGEVPRSTIDVVLEPVALDIEEEPAVRAIIDAAYEVLTEEFGVENPRGNAH